MDKETIFDQFIEILDYKYRLGGLNISEKAKAQILKNSHAMYKILEVLYVKTSECRQCGTTFLLTDKAVDECISKVIDSSRRYIGFGQD